MGLSYNLKYKENKNVRCQSCNVLIWPDSKTRLCRSCYIASNPKPNWKGGVSKKYKKCIDCKGPIKDYYSIRCRSCEDISRIGSGHWNWMGGRSFKPYPLGWTKTFKEQIRYRDGYMCQECGMPEVENGRKLDVHHIDYDKTNLEHSNLISLCRKCHCKTNFNRKYWMMYFKNIMEEK